MMALDADKILSDVPRMRRYAALMVLNDREQGDRLVEQALEDLVANPAILKGKVNFRPALLRMLQLRLQSAIIIGNGACAATTATTEPAEDVLGSMATMSIEQRSALLLVVVEGLSYEQAGYVLGVTPAIVKGLLQDARDHLGRGAA
ncbi:MAG: sigma factor-like helix-turn-helix DNA-binding protein [Alphaproteobacteria bacterium]